MHFVSLPIQPNNSSGVKRNEQLASIRQSETCPAIPPEDLERNYDLLEEKYVAIDLRKIHSNFPSITDSQPINSLHFLVTLTLS